MGRWQPTTPPVSVTHLRAALGPGETAATEALQTARLGGVVEERQEKRSKWEHFVQIVEGPVNLKHRRNSSL